MEELSTWSTAEEEAAYAEIGRFFVLFQVLESELFQICWLLGKPAHSEEDRNDLAGLAYAKLISAAGRRVYAFLLTLEKAESEFAQGFHELLHQCRQHGSRRNGIAHSGYVFLESGDDLYGIVRADVTKGKKGKGTQFDYERIEPNSIQKRFS